MSRRGAGLAARAAEFLVRESVASSSGAAPSGGAVAAAAHGPQRRCAGGGCGSSPPRARPWRDENPTTAPGPAEFARRASPDPRRPRPLAGVTAVVAVASGKGGVGKSTVAARLAVALHRGCALSKRPPLRVGFLDADITGPSAPLLFGVGVGASGSRFESATAGADGRLLPTPTASGVFVASAGLLVPPDRAAAWRGPMLSSALRTLSHGCAWGGSGDGGLESGGSESDLDVVVVDTPPGTSDVLLSLCQTVRLDGAIIVTTPQASKTRARP